MAKKKKVNPIPGFPPKWTKKLQRGLSDQGLADFIANVDGVQTKDEMIALMAESNKHLSSARKDMAEDMNLKMAKEEVKTLSEPYRGVISCQEAKIEYFLFVMSQRGWV